MSAPLTTLPLAQLQQRMIEAIYGSTPDPALLGSVRTRSGLSPESLLAIYRNSTRANLLQALRISYPVVERLVGVDFFEMAAAGYLREAPSRSGDLEQYGADLGDFLIGYEPAAALAYLADVARLEWLIAQIRRSPAPTPLDREQLAEIPSDALAELRLSLSPRAALFRSRYPAFRIWHENQDRSREPRPVSLAESQDSLLLVSGTEIFAYALSDAEYAFYECCRQGSTLAEALDVALQRKSNFDLAAALARAIEWRCLSIAKPSAAPPALDSGP